MTLIQTNLFSVYAYGTLVAAGALAAMILMRFTGKKHGLPANAVSWFAVLSVPLAFLSARAVYCLTNLKWVLERSPGFFFQFEKGGYLLFGAMAGMALAALATAKIVSCPVSRVLDAAAAPLALLIVVARLAESTVGAGYGYCIEEWFDPWMELSMIAWEDPSLLYRFPFGVQDYYETWNFAVFLPEALTALAALIVLLAMKKRRAGGAVLLFLLVYSCGQAIWESMRQDQVLRWGFIRANQFYSAMVILGVQIISYVKMTAQSRRKGRFALSIVQLFVCAGLVITMEFALEQKIKFLAWMRLDLCYIVMGLACIGLLMTVLPYWRKAFPREETAA